MHTTISFFMFVTSTTQPCHDSYFIQCPLRNKIMRGINSRCLFFWRKHSLPWMQKRQSWFFIPPYSAHQFIAAGHSGGRFRYIGSVTKVFIVGICQPPRNISLRIAQVRSCPNAGIAGASEFSPTLSSIIVTANPLLNYDLLQLLFVSSGEGGGRRSEVSCNSRCCYAILLHS